MKAVRMSVMMTVALAGLTGCSNVNSSHSEKVNVSVQSVGLSDSSGTKLEGVFQKQTIDFEEQAHRNTDLSMNREVADQVMQEAHLRGCAVALTDTNIYVAVDMGDPPNKRMSDHDKLFSKNNDPETEAGLFGSGRGAQMDWVSANPLSTESINVIKRVLTRIYPDSHIFISSNVLFVERMMFYDMEQRKNKRMDTYLHEFNTMVQYTFPSSQ